MAGVLEEVKRMQSQGLAENDIVKALRERGTSHREILEALSQSKIKAAVEQVDDDEQANQNYPSVPSPTGQETLAQEPPKRNLAPAPAGMQQSIMTPPSSNLEEISPQPESYPSENYQPEYQSYAPQDQYANTSNQYSTDYSNTYQPNLSSDIVSEISEQIVSEKMAEIRKGVEKILDFKTHMESKVETLSDRLQRIEKIIDTLQSSVLRKVGDYVTNVDDIKKELIETQKTFSKMLPELKKHDSKQTIHKKSSKKKSSK
ncbi:hypothetical protein COU60_04705 [Candidatus Pacearchaeota archaeon CG10_big_fil_rev_8_21_14_0_10_34_76]|nr:MAG: hypothetical protein COU60_04705 [Candidatus Pacearchaeota archaeon CG10_big_fil_rev_8_21_14_0_10_34_76]